MLDSEEAFDHLLFLRAGPARIHLNRPTSISSIEERIRIDEIEQFLRMRRFTRYHEKERLHYSFAGLARVGLQLDLHALVKANSILEFEPVDLIGRHPRGIEVFPCNDSRLLHK